MPFVDFSELKGRANAARSTVSNQFDSTKKSAQTAYRNHTANQPSHDDSQSSRPQFSDPAEKQALHGLLDAYFARRNSPRSRITPSAYQTPPPVKSATRPVVAAASGPKPPAQSSLVTPTAEIEAQTLAHFFAPSTSWASYPEWFAFDRLPEGSQPTPPPLATRDVIRSTSWSFRGAQKTLDGIVLFEDLSLCWYHLTWTEPRSAKREVFWSMPPSPWSGADLYTASMAYGDLLAEFAEQAERSRRHVGRGECWDLANDGLKSVADQVGEPKPMASIGRTHGHLLFTARAGQPGTWRGGENAVRRGDVIQWLTAKIKLVGQPNVTMTLGEPDHTAVVISDTAVSGLDDGDGGPDGLRQLDASCIGPLEVIEQSVKELPTRRTYDMSQFTSGQVRRFGRLLLLWKTTGDLHFIFLTFSFS